MSGSLEAEVDIKEFVRHYTKRQEDPKMRIPRGMDLSFLNPKSPDEKQIRGLIDEYNATQISDSEQELFKQVKRLADAERKLAVKETKGAPFG